jgi:NADPH-dependent glutamate synthase beta subunit-like oxidoreductase/formate hydrogenlyase subunit 6/NADH:ubiquinone oxidoreductase subunit I
MAIDNITEPTPEGCIVANTLTAIRAQLRETEGAPHMQRSTPASAARIITEIHLGRGTPAHLDELETLAHELITSDSPVAKTLAAALTSQRDEWMKHVTEYACSANVCIKPRAVPCQEACPTHIDIPSMIAHIGRGQYKESLGVLLKDTPLPNSCGLVCPAPCEDACVQKTVSAAVFIKPMKSVAARCSGGYPLLECDAPSGKKVAIVGSGPAGLTAAYYLAQKGHQIEIFDGRKEAGGIMRYGIPNYRLPAEVLNAEIDMIKSLGVIIHTDKAIANVMDLKKQGFDASFVATGLQHSRSLGVPGDNQPFVLGGMDFLRKVRNGENPRVGPHVIVIGGGNVAIDVAMTSFRQGATKVEIWYRRSRDVMPATQHEVGLALDEGVKLIELWTPARVLPDNRIEFARSKNAPDADPAQNVIVHADHIIACIGQNADIDYLDGSAIELNSGNIVADPVTLMTAEPGVFSGGDITHGTSTVVAAIGSGKRAAESIHAFLTGSEMDHASLKPQRRDNVPVLSAGAVARTDPHRPRVPEKEPVARRTSHDAIQYDFDENVARAEAERCLRCDLCIGCGLCELVCIEVGAEALRMIDTKNGRLVFDGFIRPATMCIGCGACAAVCPTGAITVETIGSERITAITGTVVRRQPLLPCSGCDQPYLTATQYEAMCVRLGTDASEPCVCPSCARMKTGEMMPTMYY